MKNKILFLSFLFFALYVFGLGSIGVPSSPDELGYASKGVRFAEPQFDFLAGSASFSPLFLSITYGIFYVFGLEVFAAKYLVPLISLFTFLVFYLLVRKSLSKDVALLASVLFLFSGKIAFFGASFLTEIPTLFILLVATLFSLRGNWFLAGLFAGLIPFFRLGFIIIGPAFIFILASVEWIRYKNKKPVIRVVMAFFVAAILLFSIYGNVIEKSFQTLSYLDSVAEEAVAGCARAGFFADDLTYSLYYLFFLPYIFTIPGFIFVFLGSKRIFNQAKKNKLIFSAVLFIILDILFFSFTPCRVIRYLFPTVPFGIILFSQVIYGFKGKLGKNAFYAVIALVLIFGLMYNTYVSSPENTAYHHYAYASIGGSDHVSCNELFLQNRLEQTNICDLDMKQVDPRARYYLVKSGEQCIDKSLVSCRKIKLS